MASLLRITWLRLPWRLLLGWPTRIVVVLAACLVAIFGFPRGDPTAPDVATTMAEQVLPTATIVVQGPPPSASPTTTVPEPPPPLDPMPFFVSPTVGDDGNDGRTPDAPWRSLQAALRRVEPGHTLYLMDGEYRELAADNFHYLARRSGTADAWIRITAAPDHEPVIVATEGTALEVEANYVEVSALTVRGEGFDESNSFGVGLSARRSHHIRFFGNTISGMPLAGISAIESSNLEILGNEVFENAFWSTAQGSGISVWHSLDWGQGPSADGYHDRIIGNRIYRNENRVKSKWKNFTTITDGNGIIIDQNRDYNYPGRTLIANNVVFDNGGRGILVFESNRVDVMFNTTYRNGWTVGLEGGPVELAAGVANDVRFINNLAWALPANPALQFSQSNVVEIAGNVLVTTNPSGLAGEADLVISADPGLVNPSIDESVADFRPEPTGVLAGRAVASKPALPFDADGVGRDPTSADVGAYELPSG